MGVGGGNNAKECTYFFFFFFLIFKIILEADKEILDPEEEEVLQNMTTMTPEDLVVKLLGRNIYILDLEQPIHSFTFIRDAFEREKRPSVLVCCFFLSFFLLFFYLSNN